MKHNKKIAKATKKVVRKINKPTKIVARKMKRKVSKKKL